MKKLSVLLLILSVSFGTSAQKPADKSCITCREIDELRQQFNNIDYMNPQARARARKELVPKALAITDKLIFTKPAPVVSAAEIKALVHLMASETPYDVESAGAGDLVILIERHKLQSVYASELKNVTEKCRRETLAYYVDSRMCSGEACKSLKPPKNLEDCLLDKKSR